MDYWRWNLWSIFVEFYVNFQNSTACKYSSARNLSIVAHALTCLPQPPNLTSLRNLQCIQSNNSMVFEFHTLFKGGLGVGGQKSFSRTDPKNEIRSKILRIAISATKNIFSSVFLSIWGPDFRGLTQKLKELEQFYCGDASFGSWLSTEYFSKKLVHLLVSTLVLSFLDQNIYFFVDDQDNYHSFSIGWK